MTQFGYVSQSSSPARRRIEFAALESRQEEIKARVAAERLVRELSGALDHERQRSAQLLEQLGSVTKEADRRVQLIADENLRLRGRLREYQKAAGIDHAASALSVVSMKQIIETVSRHFHVPVVDLKSSRRTRRVTWPRQVAMHLCRKLTTYSTVQIGRAFGGKDHTTVIQAHKAVLDRIAESRKAELEVATISVKIEQDTTNVKCGMAVCNSVEKACVGMAASD